MARIDARVEAMFVEGLVAEATVADLAWASLLGDEARTLRAATQALFWNEAAGYYAFAADRDAGGHLRVLGATQSNAGWLLALRFFDEMPNEVRVRAVSGIVRRLFAADMLTCAGLRGRSLGDHARTYRNYHEDVWPMDTFMIARGLRRQGFAELADELDARLVNATNVLGSPWEFLLVDDQGRLVHPRLDRETARRQFPRSRALPVEMLPEEDLGWSASALLRIKRERSARRREQAAAQAELDAREPWITQLSAEILAGIERTSIQRTRSDVAAGLFEMSSLYPDQAAGLRRSAGAVLVQGFGRVLPLSVLRRLRRRARLMWGARDAGPRLQGEEHSLPRLRSVEDAAPRAER